MTISPPIVSIVVPIYKVERYLRQCVDSLLAQTLRDIEIILVDDGSPDGCPAIVDEYAAADSRVVAIHQPNGGYGRAVNHGISRARGEYIGIIESDDWVEPTMYEKLLNRARETGVDVVKCMFWKYDSTAAADQRNILWNNPKFNWLTAPDKPFAPAEWDIIFSLHASLWSNLYRADFLRGIPLIESASAAYQDFPFVMEVLGRARSMSMLKEPLLHYRMEADQGSSTMRNDARLVQMPVMSMKGCEVLEQLGVLNKVKEAFFYHAYCANIRFQQNIQEEYAQEFFNHFKALMSKIKDYPDFSFKYFNRKEKKRTLLVIEGESRECLKKRWRIQLRKGLLTLILNGKTFSCRLWG